MFYIFCDTENSTQDSLFINKIDKFAILSNEKNFHNVIYALIDPNSFEIRYVGLTKDLRKRLSDHLNRLKPMTHKNNWIKSLLEKDQKLIVLVIKHLENYYDLYQEEINYISYCKSVGCDLTNATDGGKGAIGAIFSKEHIEKLSKSRKNTPNKGQFKKGIIPWNKGVPASEESKKKNSQSKLGRTPWNKGISPSEESKEKNRQAHLGRVLWNKGKNSSLKILFSPLETIEIMNKNNKVKDLSAKHNCSISIIKRVRRETRKLLCLL